ncbi:MAG: sensor histidine kinase [Bacteriovoracia bacterium]
MAWLSRHRFVLGLLLSICCYGAHLLPTMLSQFIKEAVPVRYSSIGDSDIWEYDLGGVGKPRLFFVAGMVRGACYLKNSDKVLFGTSDQNFETRTSVFLSGIVESVNKRVWFVCKRNWAPFRFEYLPFFTGTNLGLIIQGYSVFLFLAGIVIAVGILFFCLTRAIIEKKINWEMFFLGLVSLVYQFSNASFFGLFFGTDASYEIHPWLRLLLGFYMCYFFLGLSKKLIKYFMLSIAAGVLPFAISIPYSLFGLSQFWTWSILNSATVAIPLFFEFRNVNQKKIKPDHIKDILNTVWFFNFVLTFIGTSLGLSSSSTPAFLILLLIMFFKKEIENRLSDSIRLAEMSNTALIAAQVAHDIKSPLALIRAVQQGAPKLDKQERILLGKALARIESIASNLLYKSKAVFPSRNHNTCVNKVIEQLVHEKRIEYSYRKQIVLDIVLPKKDLWCSIAEVDLSRVLSNLINNSYEAIEGSGRIVVTALEDREWIVVLVSDDGPGVSQGVLENLGEIGCTEKHSGGGTWSLSCKESSRTKWGRISYL